jgi:hypothetical protein
MRFLQKYRKLLMLLGDGLVAAGAFLAERLSGWMLMLDKPCDWTRIGAQCGTCGGTRCVSNFLHGNFAEAFALNPFVFLCGVYALVSLLLLNLYILFDWEFAWKALKKMYNLVTFFIALGGYVVFTIIRNIPFIIQVLELWGIP